MTSPVGDDLSPALLRQAIVKRRQELGLTLKEVAERAGTTSPQLSKVENGHVGIGLDLARRLLAALGLEAKVVRSGQPKE